MQRGWAAGASRPSAQVERGVGEAEQRENDRRPGEDDDGGIDARQHKQTTVNATRQHVQHGCAENRESYHQASGENIRNDAEHAGRKDSCERGGQKDGRETRQAERGDFGPWPSQLTGHRYYARRQPGVDQELNGDCRCKHRGQHFGQKTGVDGNFASEPGAGALAESFYGIQQRAAETFGISSEIDQDGEDDWRRAYESSPEHDPADWIPFQCFGSSALGWTRKQREIAEPPGGQCKADDEQKNGKPVQHERQASRCEQAGDRACEITPSDAGDQDRQRTKINKQNRQQRAGRQRCE